MRIYRGVVPFAIIASRSAQGLLSLTSGTTDRTIPNQTSLPQDPTSHAPNPETRDTRIYTCPNGACTYSASSAAQAESRVPLPLMVAGAGLATILGAHALAIPLAIVAFSDSATAEPIPHPSSKSPTPEIPQISMALPSPSPNAKDEFSVSITPTSLPTLSTAPNPNHDLSTRAAGAVAGGPCAPMDALACTGDYFLVCRHGGTWTNTGSMGSNYVCEDGVPASTQCENDPSSGSPAQPGAGAGTAPGTSSNTAPAHSPAPRSRRGTLLLSAALAAALNGYAIALPVALFALLQPATAALTTPLAPLPLPGVQTSIPNLPPLPAAPVRSAKLSIRAACSDNGALSCADGGNSFFLCSEGALVDMGHVAAGTVCVDGGIVAAAAGAAAGAGAGAGAGARIDSGAVGRTVRLGLLVGGLALSALGDEGLGLGLE